MRRKATASLRMDNRSNFDNMFCSKGSSEARWSSSPLSLSRCLFDGLLFVWGWLPLPLAELTAASFGVGRRLLVGGGILNLVSILSEQSILEMCICVQRFCVRLGRSCVIGPVWPVGAGCYSQAALPMPLSKPLYGRWCNQRLLARYVRIFYSPTNPRPRASL